MKNIYCRTIPGQAQGKHLFHSGSGLPRRRAMRDPWNKRNKMDQATNALKKVCFSIF